MLSLIIAALGTAYSIYQGISSSQDADKPRTPYQIPQADFDMLKMAQVLANSDMPGKNELMSLTNGNMSHIYDLMMKHAANPSETEGILASLQTQKNKSDLQIGAMNDDWKAKQQQQLMSAEGVMAGQQEKKQYYDTILPEQQNYERAVANESNATYSTFKGLGSLAGGLDAMNKTNTTDQNLSPTASNWGVKNLLSAQPSDMAPPAQSPMDKMSSPDASKNMPFGTQVPQGSYMPKDNWQDWLNNMLSNKYTYRNQQPLQ